MSSSVQAGFGLDNFSKSENYLCYSPNVVWLIYNVVQPYAVLCSPYAGDSENKVNSTQLEL